MTRQARTRIMAALCGCLPLAAAFAQGALKPVDAVIVNPATRPVPVTVLSTPAQPGEGSREIYRRVSELVFTNFTFTCSELQTVPAGKRLVLQYLGGTGTLNAPAALVYVSIRTQVDGPDVDLVVPAAAPLSSSSPSGVNHSAAGQQVHAYFDSDFRVCAETSSFGSATVIVSLRGYLVNRP